ncbi:uncharacterized protein OCT59_028892 [Rhizophagus irregularis]|uniref:uncharacterized protein n=1 Tax=Rhizophagus irregularis TaxID=588596 RepID=UPI001A05708B|nr:hypothetical protein OCT59_028892 [Rhizophagus irregularis]GBC52436.2 hypothetical protein RIR_jg27301.t1 [Rhizophagus irregularis DAOM 181602=DAOM 197198]CAG8738488.1 18644_t:CDS:2 [Rhizophagus irregularis]
MDNRNKRIQSGQFVPSMRVEKLRTMGHLCAELPVDSNRKRAKELRKKEKLNKAPIPQTLPKPKVILPEVTTPPSYTASSLNCSAEKFKKFKNFFPNGPVTSRSEKTVYQVGSSKWWQVTKLNYNKHQDKIKIAQGFIIQQQEHDNRLQLDAMMNGILSNCSHTLQTYITTDTNRSRQNNLLPNNNQTLHHNILVSNKILTWITALKQNISLTTR